MVVITQLVGGPVSTRVSWTSESTGSYKIYYRAGNGAWAVSSPIAANSGVLTGTIPTPTYDTYTVVLVRSVSGSIPSGGISVPAKITTGGTTCFRDITIEKINNTLTIIHPEYNIPDGATLKYLIRNFRDWQPSDGGSDLGPGSLLDGAGIIRDVLPTLGPNDTPTSVVVDYTGLGVAGVSSYSIHVTAKYTLGGTVTDIPLFTKYRATSSTPSDITTYSPSVSVTPDGVTVSWGTVFGYNITSAVLEVYQSDDMSGLGKRRYGSENIGSGPNLSAGSKTYTFNTNNKFYSAKVVLLNLQTGESPIVRSPVQAIFPLDFTFIPGNNIIRCPCTLPVGKSLETFIVYYSVAGVWNQSNFSNNLVGDINTVNGVPNLLAASALTTDGILYISSQNKIVSSYSPPPPTDLTVTPVSYNVSPTYDVNLQFTLPPYASYTANNITVNYGFSNVVSSEGRPLTEGVAPANSYQMVDYTNVVFRSLIAGTHTITLSGMRTGNFTTSATNPVAGNSFTTPTNGLTISFTPTYQVRVNNVNSAPATSLIECVEPDSADAYIAAVNSTVPVIQARALTTTDVTVLPVTTATTQGIRAPPGSLFEYQVSPDASSWYTLSNASTAMIATLTTPAQENASITLSGTRLPLPLYYRFRVFTGDSPIPIATSLPSTDLIKHLIFPPPLANPTLTTVGFNITPSGVIDHADYRIRWTETPVPTGATRLYSFEISNVSGSVINVVRSPSDSADVNILLPRTTRIRTTPRHQYAPTVLGGSGTSRASKTMYDITIAPAFRLTQTLCSDNASIVVSGAPFLNASVTMIVQSTGNNPQFIPAEPYRVDYTSNVTIPWTYLNNNVTIRVARGEAVASNTTFFNLAGLYPALFPASPNSEERDYLGCQNINGNLAVTFKGRPAQRARVYYSKVGYDGTVTAENFVPRAETYELLLTSGINETRDGGNEYITNVTRNPATPDEVEMVEIVIVYVSSLGLEGFGNTNYGFL